MPARVLIMPEVILRPTIHQQDQALVQHLVIIQVHMVYLQAAVLAYLEKARMVLEVLVISAAAVVQVANKAVVAKVRDKAVYVSLTVVHLVAVAADLVPATVVVGAVSVPCVLSGAAVEHFQLQTPVQLLL
jgi:hypothetical protein